MADKPIEDLLKAMSMAELEDAQKRIQRELDQRTGRQKFQPPRSSVAPLVTR
jgi:hypothetical protein